MIMRPASTTSLCERNFYAEGGSLTRRGCHVNAPALKLHEIFGDIKSKAGASLGSWEIGQEPLFFEQFPKHVSGYSYAGIRYLYHGESIFTFRSNGNGSLFRKFLGIANEIL